MGYTKINSMKKSQSGMLQEITIKLSFVRGFSKYIF